MSSPAEFDYIDFVPTKSFDYLNEKIYYFDSACQSLRPHSILKSELKYYTQYNACAGRGNHLLVQEVDNVVSHARKLVLDFVGKSNNSYVTVFTPNTTYGINLILSNLDWSKYKHVITTHKEHNSVLLPAISFAKKYNKNFAVLDINPDGTLNVNNIRNLSGAVIILQTTSNLDGLSIANLEDFVEFAKRNDNLVLLDCAQTMGHVKLDLYDLDFDCIFASAHKMYAPSLGFMVIKRELVLNLDQTWVGGGTVQKVTNWDYDLINYKDDLASRLEFGLQDYAAIFALQEAIVWLRGYQVADEYEKIKYRSSTVGGIGEKIIGAGPNIEVEMYLESLSELLFDNLQDFADKGLVQMLNRGPSSIISLLPLKISSYELSRRLSTYGIMCRAGVMCCHHYIQDVLKMPPLLRISLGLNNTPGDILHLIKALATELNKA